MVDGERLGRSMRAGLIGNVPLDCPPDCIPSPVDVQAFAASGESIRIRQLGPEQTQVVRGDIVSYHLYRYHRDALIAVEVDGIFTSDEPFSFTGNYPLNQAAATFTGANAFYRLIPTDVPGRPDLLKVCSHMESPVAKRLVCTIHRESDDLGIGVEVSDDIGGTVTFFSATLQ